MENLMKLKKYFQLVMISLFLSITQLGCGPSIKLLRLTTTIHTDLDSSSGNLNIKLLINSSDNVSTVFWENPIESKDEIVILESRTWERIGTLIFIDANKQLPSDIVATGVIIKSRLAKKYFESQNPYYKSNHPFIKKSVLGNLNFEKNEEYEVDFLFSSAYDLLISPDNIFYSAPDIEPILLQIPISYSDIYSWDSWYKKYSTSRPLPDDTLFFNLWKLEDVINNIFYKWVIINVIDYETAMPIKYPEITIKNILPNGELTEEQMISQIKNNSFIEIYKTHFNSIHSIIDYYPLDSWSKTDYSKVILGIPGLNDLTERVSIIIRKENYKYFEGELTLGTYKSMAEYIIKLPRIGQKINIEINEPQHSLIEKIK